MEELLVLATESGIVLCGRVTDTWSVSHRSLESHPTTAVIAREGVILAGTTDGIFRSDDSGHTWEDASAGLSARHVRWLAFHPAVSDLEFAGTEPAAIFVSHDGGGAWSECPEVARLRDKYGWFLPYSPEAGCVRSFAFHGNHVYAGVEVGGVLLSEDSGESWRLAAGSSGEPNFDIPPEPWVHADIHSIVVHPSSPDLVYAATAEGLYRSADGGNTWIVSHLDSYCRAVWVDPGDPEHIVLGPSPSVSQMNGRVEESRDGGATWNPAGEGLGLPWPGRMMERFTQIGDDLFAVTNDGRLYVSSLNSLHWRRILPDAGRIRAIAPISPN